MSLRWQKKETKDFNKILINCLEMAMDHSLIMFEIGKWNKKNDVFQCAFMFPNVELFRSECKKLIKAIKSPKLFMPTEYHFYMMWSIMNVCSDIDFDCGVSWFEMHGEEAQNIIEEGYKNREGQDCIDYCETICEDAKSSFSYIEDIYFWDLDFLFLIDACYNNESVTNNNCTLNKTLKTKDLRMTVYKEK